MRKTKVQVISYALVFVMVCNILATYMTPVAVKAENEVQTVNFLKNGDFEQMQGMSITVTPKVDTGKAFGESGWRVYPPSAGVSPVTFRVVSGGKDSEYALKISGDEEGQRTDAKLYQTVSGLDVTKTYTLSMWVKGEKVSTIENSTISVELSANETNLLEQYESNGKGESVWSTDWFLMSGDAVPDEEGKIRVDCNVRRSTSGYWLFDEITLVEKEEEAPPVEEAPTVAITQEKAEVKFGTPSKLEYTSGGTNTVTKWSSSDESIVSVNEKTGEMTAQALGTAKITVTVTNSVGTASDSCDVTAVHLYNGSFENGIGADIELEKGGGTFDVGTSGYRCWTSKGSIHYQIISGEAYEGNGALKLSRTEGTETASRGMATHYMRGLIEGRTYRLSGYVKAVGTNTKATFNVQYENTILRDMTAATGDGEWELISYDFVATAPESEKNGYCIKLIAGGMEEGYFLVDDLKLELLPREPQLILSEEELEVEIGNSKELTVMFSDPDQVFEEIPEIQWSNVNDSVVTITTDMSDTSKVVLCGLAEGESTIIIKAGSLETICLIKVVKPVVPLVGISMEKELELYEGSTKTLDVLFTPENTTQKALLWKTDAEDIVKIDAEGTITALKEGTAKVTATDVNGHETVCVVTVKKSTLLKTTHAQLSTPYGTALHGDLNDYVTNTSGNSLTYVLLEEAQNGTLLVNADGTFTYVPEGNYDVENTDSFKTAVSTGTETAIVEATVTVNELELDIWNSSIKMLLSEEALEELRQLVKTEGTVQNKIWEKYEPSLKALKTATPPKFDAHTESENTDALWMREVGNNTLHLLIAYLITEDEVYKDKCMEFIQASLDYPKWGTNDWWMEADLAAAHQVYAISIAYTWLKDDAAMTSEMRQDIVNRLYYSCMAAELKRGDSTQFMQNHLWIGITSLLAGTIALASDADYVVSHVKIDENMTDWEREYTKSVTMEEFQNDCEKWLDLVLDKLCTSYSYMPSDGSNHEGAGYAAYGTEWLLKCSMLLERHFGIDTLTGNGYLENHSDYFLNVMYPKNTLSGSASLLNYADGFDTSQVSQNFRVLAAIYKDAQAQWIAEAFEEADADSTGAALWMGLLYADGSVEAKLDTAKSTMYLSKLLGLAVARSDWSGDESLALVRCGLPLGRKGNLLPKLGSTNEYHVAPDCNAIVLLANGEYLLKSDGYSIKQTSNHSTLLVNGKGQIGETMTLGFDGDLFAELEELEPTMTVVADTDTYSYFVGNATDAYPAETNLKKFERNIVFLKEENVMLVVDDIKTGAKQELELRWFPGGKSVTESYGIYTVYGSKNTMQFYPFSNGEDTAYEDVTVYYKDTTGQNEGAFVQKVSASTWQNAVAFSWNKTGQATEQVKYLAGSADEHQFEVNGKIYRLNVSNNTLSVEKGSLNVANGWESDSKLSGITFNGALLEGFDSDVTEYTLERFWKTEDLVIAGVPNAPTITAKVEWDGSCPGTAYITCTSEDNTSRTKYTLHLKNDNGMLGIKKGEAIPNVAGIDVGLTYDNYIQEVGSDKTWSSVNLPVVTWELESLSEVKKVDVAFNYSRDRVTYYDLFVSEDGENWITLKETATAGKTSGTARNAYQTIYEGDAVSARYIRIALRAHGQSIMDEPAAYNSIQEISIYGTKIVMKAEEQEYSRTTVGKIPEKYAEGTATGDSCHIARYLCTLICSMSVAYRIKKRRIER